MNWNSKSEIWISKSWICSPTQETWRSKSQTWTSKMPIWTLPAKETTRRDRVHPTYTSARAPLTKPRSLSLLRVSRTRIPRFATIRMSDFDRGSHRYPNQLGQGNAFQRNSAPDWLVACMLAGLLVRLLACFLVSYLLASLLSWFSPTCKQATNTKQAIRQADSKQASKQPSKQ